jgi:hypothetical protein
MENENPPSNKQWSIDHEHVKVHQNCSECSPILQMLCVIQITLMRFVMIWSLLLKIKKNLNIRLWECIISAGCTHTWNWNKYNPQDDIPPFEGEIETAQLQIHLIKGNDNKNNAIKIWFHKVDEVDMANVFAKDDC